MSDDADERREKLDVDGLTTELEQLNREDELPAAPAPDVRSDEPRRLRPQLKEQDLLCINGCGFYGSPQWEMLCSACWRQRQLHEKRADNYARNRNLLATAEEKPQSLDELGAKISAAAGGGTLTIKNFLRRSSDAKHSVAATAEQPSTSADSTRSTPIAMMKRQFSQPVGRVQSMSPSGTPQRSRRLSHDSEMAKERLSAFLQEVDRPLAHEIARMARSAVHKIMELNVDPDDLSGLVQNFYQTLRDTIEASIAANNSTTNPVTTDELLLEVEQYVCVRAYSWLFCPNSDEEIVDLSLQEHIRSLHWVTTAGFLDTRLDFTKQSVSDAVDDATAELIDMNAHRAPSAKLGCLLRAVQRIFDALRWSNDSPGEDSDDTASSGADDFLPVLIYALLKGNPPLILSNVKFVLRFALPSRTQTGENAYYFTNLSCALQFVQDINHDSLRMEKDEFEAYRCGNNLRVLPFHRANNGHPEPDESSSTGNPVSDDAPSQPPPPFQSEDHAEEEKTD